MENIYSEIKKDKVILKHVLLIGSSDSKFEKNILNCLTEESICKTFFKNKILNLDFDLYVEENKIEIVIFNLLRTNTRRKIVEELKKILRNENIKKVILLESAKDLYRKNTLLPFSVYNKFFPKSKISKYLIQYEELIKKSQKEYTVFRISELYGPSVDFGLIHNLLTSNSVSLNCGEIDFLYEGDCIQAIETAIKSNSMGIFDIANGTTVKLKDVITLVNKLRKKEVKVFWKKKKEVFRYNCENFKFYKWQPIVNFETGLMAIKNFKKSIYNIYTKTKKHFSIGG